MSSSRLRGIALSLAAVLVAVLVLTGCGGNAQRTITATPINCTAVTGVAYRPCGAHVKGWATQPPPAGTSLQAPTATPTREMYDSVTLSAVPSSPWAVGCYAVGTFANCGQALSFFPHAHLLTITPRASAAAGCLDIEPLDAVPSEASSWVKWMVSLHHYRPCVYSSVSEMPQVRANLTANGVPLTSVRIWCAWYRFVPGLIAGCDAVQWTDHSLGRNLDESTARADFFAPPAPPGPTPAQIKAWTGARDSSLRAYHAQRCKLPVFSTQSCYRFGNRVVYFQGKLGHVSCFSAHAAKAAAVCQIVIPRAAARQRAAESSRRASVRLGCVNPAQFWPRGCGPLERRYARFIGLVSTDEKAWR